MIQIKVNVLTLSLLCAVILSGFSLPKNRPVLPKGPITWLGFDFTKSKMIGSVGFSHPDIICERYVHQKWNGIVFTESDKYDIGKIFKGREIIPNGTTVENRNKTVTTEGLIIDSNHSISKEECNEVISHYSENKGLAFLIVVESFNKLEGKGYFWPVVFNPKTQEIYFCTRISGNAGGMGVLNYWAASMRNALKKCRQQKIETLFDNENNQY